MTNNPVLLGFRIDKMETQMKKLTEYDNRIEDLELEMTTVKN